MKNATSLALPAPATDSASAPAPETNTGATAPEQSAPGSQAGGESAPESSRRELEQANAKLRSQLDAATGKLNSTSAELAEMKAAKVIESNDEEIIRRKMTKGLTRAQATAVLRRQRAYDATPYAKKKRAQVIAAGFTPKTL